MTNKRLENEKKIDDEQFGFRKQIDALSKKQQKLSTDSGERKKQ